MVKRFGIKQIIVGAAFLIAVAIFFTSFTEPNPILFRSSAIILLTLVLWSTGIIPPFLTALIFFILLLIFKIADPSLIFSGFGSAAVWLIISGFVIGSAITISGLGQRLAASLQPLLGGSYFRMIAGLTIVAMLFGFIMPSSVGRSVVLVPIGMALADQVGLSKGSKGRIGIAVTLAMACNMPSFAILTSNIPNMILSGAAETIYHTSIHYTDYLFLHFPVLGILKSVLLIGLVNLLFAEQIKTNNEIPEPSTASSETQFDHAAQCRVGLILCLTLVLWMTDSLHHINPAWVGMISAVVLLLPSIGVIAPKSFNASVDFGMVLFVAAALGLGAVVNATGLGAVVANHLESLLPLRPGHVGVNFFSLSLMSTLTGIITTIPGVPTVLTPMAQDLATASGLSLQSVIMTQVIGFSTVIFPYQVGPLIVAMQLSGESLSQLLKVTFPLAFITFVLLVPIDYFWWHLLGWL